MEEFYCWIFDSSQAQAYNSICDTLGFVHRILRLEVFNKRETGEYTLIDVQNWPAQTLNWGPTRQLSALCATTRTTLAPEREGREVELQCAINIRPDQTGSLTFWVVMWEFNGIITGQAE